MTQQAKTHTDPPRRRKRKRSKSSTRSNGAELRNRSGKAVWGAAGELPVTSGLGDPDLHDTARTQTYLAALIAQLRADGLIKD